MPCSQLSKNITTKLTADFPVLHDKLDSQLIASPDSQHLANSITARQQFYHLSNPEFHIMVLFSTHYQLYSRYNIICCYKAIHSFAAESLIISGKQGCKFSRPMWPRGQNFRPRPRPHAMLASYSSRLSLWSCCQSLKSRRLRYVLLCHFTRGICVSEVQ